MHTRLPVYLVFLLVLPLWVAAGDRSWESIKETESDLAYLESLASFSLSEEVSAFSEVLLSMEELSEMRRAATVAVILDQWMRQDPGGLEKAMQRQWDQLDTSVHGNYLQLALKVDPKATTQRLFDEKDPVSQYRDDLMYELIRLNPGAVAKHLSKSKKSETHSQWSDALVRSWMQSSPEDAFEWAIANREDVDLTQIFSNLLYSNNPDAKAKLGALWDKLPKEARTVELQSDVANRLVYSDPELALEFIEGLPDEERYRLTHRVMGRLAESKSPKAAEIMQTLPQAHLPNTHTVKKVLLEWGLREPEEALAWADKIEDAKLRVDALARMNTVLGMRDPQLAIDQAMAAPEGELRKTLIRNVALLLAKSDLEEGLSWVDALPESDGKQLALQSIAHLVDRMPVEKLLAEGLKMQPTRSTNNFVDRLFDRWCQDNIEAAAEWFLEQPESEQNSSREHDVGYELAVRTPDLALEYLFSESTPMGVRKKIYSTYMGRYGDRPEMLQVLVDELRPEHAGTLLSTHELRSLGRIEPMMAYELAGKLPEKDQARAIGYITTSWAETDPVGLASYLKNHELDARYNYTRVAEGFANRDFDNAVGWVEALETGEPLHYGVIGLARHLTQTSPAEAFDLMQRFEDQSSRSTSHSANRTYEDILKQWAYFDPGAALKALEDSSLPEKQKSKFLKSIENLEIEP